jgi:hypothetical protein
MVRILGMAGIIEHRLLGCLAMRGTCPDRRRCNRFHSLPLLLGGKHPRNLVPDPLAGKVQTLVAGVVDAVVERHAGYTSLFIVHAGLAAIPGGDRLFDQVTLIRVGQGVQAGRVHGALEYVLIDLAGHLDPGGIHGICVHHFIQLPARQLSNFLAQKKPASCIETKRKNINEN